MSPTSCPEQPTTPRWTVWLRVSAVVVGCVLLSLLFTQTVQAAPDPPVQVYYLPMPEDQAFAALRAIFPGNAFCAKTGSDVREPITNYISVSVVVSGTRIYYDHWEDGYEDNLSQPVQPSTEIWGDGNPSNGYPPYPPELKNTDLFAANTVVLLTSDVPVSNRPANVNYYDGRDRLGSTRSVAITRAVWANDTDTMHAGALEVYPLDRWGTTYRAAVGVDTVSPSTFEYTSFAVMAAEDGTQVSIDLDADGNVDVIESLDEGEGYLSAGSIAAGATVSATAPVQVALITGDICDTFESRWYVPFPVEQWANRYYSPVSTAPGYATTVYLFNPGSTDLSVTREIAGGGIITLTVPASGTLANQLPAGTGAAFSAVDPNRHFSAVAAVDTTSETNFNFDWGFDLVPVGQLTAQTLIGWGAGRDPGSAINPNENGSPIWVMGVWPNGESDPIEICVDYDGDNVAANQDSNGFFYDRKLVLPEFVNARVFDPNDRDQTGMLLYICDGSVAGGAQLVAAWGQDPESASIAEPGLDLGTTAPPAATFEAGKTYDLIDDLDGDGKADAGDALRYTIVVRNASRVNLPNVVVSDTVPLHTTYLLSTTTVATGTATIDLPDSSSGTPFPLDDGGVDLGPMSIGAVFTVTFGVRLDNPLPPDVTRILNRATVVVGGETAHPEVPTPVDRDPAINLVKTATHTVVVSGRTVTYTFTVSNSGGELLQDVALVDNRCATIFVGGDTGNDGILALDEIWTYTCSAVITQTTVNTATVTAQTAAGEEVSDTDTWTVRLFSGRLYLPIIRTPRVDVPCPPEEPCPLTSEIKAMAVHEGNNLLYVVSRNPDRLLKVDPVSVEILDEAATGVQPWGIVVNEQTNRVYVSNFMSSDIWVYTADTLDLVTKIAVGTAPSYPSLLEILPGQNTVFALLRNDSRVAIIQGETLVQDIGSAGSRPFGIAADAINQRIYISHRDSHSMSMVRKEGGVWQSFAGPILADQRRLFELAYNPDTQLLYSVYADVAGNWNLGFWEPKVVGDWGQFGTVDLPSGGDLNSPDVGGAGLAVNPSTEHVFNVNTGAGSLSVINGSVPAILGGVALGNDPFAIAINSTANTVFIGLRSSGSLIKLSDAY